MIKLFPIITAALGPEYEQNIDGEKTRLKAALAWNVESNSYIPICYEGWNEEWSNVFCEQLGHG